MRIQPFARILAAAFVAGLLAGPAAAQARSLQYHPPIGRQDTFQQVSKTEMTTQAGDRKVVDAAEATFLEVELVTRELADPAGVQLAVYRTGEERQTALQDGGRDVLAGVPEDRRRRPLSPSLALQHFTRNHALKGEPAKTQDPKEALSALALLLKVLPADPVKPGDTWTRQVDLGVVKATLTWRFAEEKTVNDKPCAMIEGAVQAVFQGDLANVLTVEKMESTGAEALDGAGRVWEQFNFTLAEKGEKASRRSVRTVETKLVDSKQVAPEQLAKARADLDRIEEAIKQSNTDHLEEALNLLAAYIRDNPDGQWTPAVRGLFVSLQDRLIMTKPIAPLKLRAVLKELQVKHDRTVAAGNTQDAVAVNRVIQQIVGINLQTLLQEAENPDPVVRDLASFALAFTADPTAREKLLALAADRSPQVRGTATLSLVIQGQGVPDDLLMARLGETDDRIRGGAVLLAARTVKPGDSSASAALPLVLDVLKAQSAWARANAISAAANLAPKGSKTAAAALIAAYKAEKEEALKPAYLAALAQVTEVKASAVEPYEAWLNKPPQPKG